ncbi:Protein CBG26419 [Caenorhabditis briggsae]|uniref:Protein CBG26419 n=1 Tax=Caenorhabditis briggsae TaxID=6238 RepID=B6ILF2_CAEBR|nr:Protein CBG26419 [Caenorhabditis briggsae]CAS00732.1 Protein CBG26419 [Caenorhabditis briggsae]
MCRNRPGNSDLVSTHSNPSLYASPPISVSPIYLTA